ncbi:PREDICTED: titin-like [Poecilia mexicana]|uniref:titin-like n=1 Tax=Poecilia mexicana TaxID=48701 RepID=UPI00072E56AB|nr:PREDICTED: titin-like [Poecilia mexicana]
MSTVSIKPTVTWKHNWSEIFRGETVTLRCEIRGEAEWTYEWRINDQDYQTSSESISITADSRGFWCKGTNNYGSTQWSDFNSLPVSTNKPRATMTASPTIIPAGGSVTLTCSVSGSDGWKFDLLRRQSVDHKDQFIRTNDPDGVFIISDEGVYSCRGGRGGRGGPVFYTETSIKVIINETVSIKPTVTRKPDWSEIFRGETVTLRCEIRGGTWWWTYEWRTNYRNSPKSSEYKIIAADRDTFSCRGRRNYQFQFTQWSDNLSLTVLNKPAAKLTAGDTIIPAGGSVTLTCSVSGSDGWKFDLLRRQSVHHKDQTIRTNEPDGVFIISVEGVYSCRGGRGGRGGPVFYTETSIKVIINEIGEFSFCSSLKKQMRSES